MRPGRRAFFGLTLAAIFLIAGCAQPERAIKEFGSEKQFWQGRLALRIDSDNPQSFSAAFELSGNAQSGALVLSSPLGSTLAALSWTPDTAVMRANGELRRFGSLDELLRQATGAALPIAALFAWLGGDQATAPGWLADLTQLGTGRLTARRTTPLPEVELRLVLEPAS
ncbi:MAG: hypothetical protein KJ852_03720 [Gammaproteobacteria bacterium]|nr:hypothetical protein [Gammaproteobacteria bacterium]MBU0787692.1 hypothetical protein [Gammaproteobacteria bacterium]MBU0814838.1 hypothetical protein [Gammaproteobacteria bacterium]MBU1786054.1 hypothetical protein [Gammaproteobacteria bacterium]